MKDKKIFYLPEVASWESTLSCPMRCKHCGLNAGQKNKNELGEDESKKMLTKLRDFGIKDLVISGGEFTWRKDWVSILKFSLSLFESVRVITSGWMGDKIFNYLEDLKNIKKLILSVSLDGAKESHDERRGVGSFEKVYEMLAYQTDIPRTVLTTVDTLNIRDCLDVLSLCLRFRVSIWSIQICLPEGRMDPKLFLGFDMIRFFAEEIKIWQEKYKDRIIISPDDCFANLFPMRNYGEWGGCHAARRLITILSDGSITGCPTMSNIKAGNIKEDDLQDVWESKTMNCLRYQVPEECKVCGKCAGGCKTISKMFGSQFCFLI